MITPNSNRANIIKYLSNVKAQIVDTRALLDSLCADEFDGVIDAHNELTNAEDSLEIVIANLGDLEDPESESA